MQVQDKIGIAACQYMIAQAAYPERQAFYAFAVARLCTKYLNPAVGVASFGERGVVRGRQLHSCCLFVSPCSRRACEGTSLARPTVAFGCSDPMVDLCSVHTDICSKMQPIANGLDECQTEQDGVMVE